VLLLEIFDIFPFGQTTANQKYRPLSCDNDK
jgi:hypothetical protein